MRTVITVVFKKMLSMSYLTVFYRHVHKSLRSKSKSSLKSLRSSLSQVSSL